MKIHHKTREFHIVNEPAYDLKVIYLLEHFFGQDEDDTPVYLKTKILTKDGWRDHTNGICYPISRLPSISGQDMWLRDKLEARLLEWETHIREHLGD